MKIIALLRSDLTTPATVSTPARIVPDSALLLPGRPLFVPDLGGGWQAQPAAAIRIGRLGRDISPKFAARYVDGVTLALWLRLAQHDETLSAGLLDSLDSSLALGTWLDVPPATAVVTTPVAETAIDFTAEISTVIPAVSRYATLKMGDVILTSFAGPAIDLKPDTRLTASIDHSEVLSIKIL